MNHFNFARPGRYLLYICLLCTPALASAQMDYTEDLSLFGSTESVKLRVDYGAYSGWEPWGVGASLHGFVGSGEDDDEEYGGLVFAGYAGLDTALRIGGGYQQRDQETGSGPVVDVRWVKKFDPVATLQLFVQNEIDAAGLGVGIRYHLVAEVLEWMDIDFLIEAAYYEELGEDIDGYAAILLEPFRQMDVIHIGPAVSLDEEAIEVGLILLIAN